MQMEAELLEGTKVYMTDNNDTLSNKPSIEVSSDPCPYATPHWDAGNSTRVGL